jgi:probable H4MPT-linked C1 transfer pathway protein
VFIATRNGVLKKLITESLYFPVWKNPEKLGKILTKLTRKLTRSTLLDLVAVTMTAELSDAYRTKREGVNRILIQIEKAFPTTHTLILDVDAQLRTVQEARAEPIKVAAANWAATGLLISQLKKDCLVIDVGSTTTSVIPILNGVIAAEAKTDLEKLTNGELIYTGTLRTNVAATVQNIRVKGGTTQVSSELFAQSADIHLILGHISEKEYTVETADGKGINRQDSLARLARVVCADIELLSEQEIVTMAQYVYEKQVEQIANGLRQVRGRIDERERKIAAVVTGLGRKFLARKAALSVGFSEIVDFGELVNVDVAIVSTAFAVALIGASHLERRSICWLQ